MKLKITRQHFHEFLVLLPFLLVYIGTIFQNVNSRITSLFKIAAIAFMLVYIISNAKYNKNLVIGTTIFVPFLIYGILICNNYIAGLSDGLRYLFPIIALFYGYAIRKYYKLILKFVIAFIIINFLVQIVNYVNWLRGVNQWFYYTTDSGFIHYNRTAGIMRATGTVVFFGFFGFLNMIGFFLINKFYLGPYKRYLLAISLFGLAASISYKAFAAFVIVLLIYYYKHIYKVIGSMLLLLVGIYIGFPDKINSFGEDVVIRISLYLTEGNSARSESYRVMFNEIANFNFFGRGVGVFGGPASTQYDSTFYKAVGFNWHGTEWLNLKTTDTYLPHLFVELGIIGALIYLFVLIIPLLRKKVDGHMALVLVIYFCLFFDMLFSFSLNNIEYLLFSLVFVYPIFAHQRAKKLSRESTFN